jgi:uncharacterized protein with NAD-binding domain and iron-sulfur cluster
MAGLAAAWELSRPEHQDEIAGVTVYQRGWRLGGKGASSRGVHGRIEEHGLHLWPGYYDNSFRLIRQVYVELDRPANDPACPIASWRDAFAPAEAIAVADRRVDGSPASEPWVASFRGNGSVPGDEAAPLPLGAARFAERSTALLADLWTSLSRARRPPAGVFLSASPRPPGVPGGDLIAGLGGVLGRAEVVALVGALRALELTEAAAGGPAPGPLRAAVIELLGELSTRLRARVRTDAAARRLWQLADLLTACLRGMVADGLIAGPHRYPAIDDLDFRTWLEGHGAAPETLSSPIVNALYDFTFAYEGGDPERPAFAAGLGLFLASKLFFEYKGALFWRMRAGMGDVVFAPLYQALRGRGVRFELFCRVDALRLDAAGRRVASVELVRQAQPASAAGYDPLVRVRGLPCFPAGPVADRLAGPPPRDTECHGADRRAGVPLVLRAGEDYDVVVLAVSLGMVPHVCGDLLRASAAWRDMVSHVATVPTQAAQLWLTRSEAELGWAHRGATLSGGHRPFDTYASMSHLLAAEAWPPDDAPRGLAYLCSVRPDRPGADESSVRAALGMMLGDRMGGLWPAAPPDPAGDGVLHGGLGAQHVVASPDPSDRYVQSLPGTGRFRLRPGGSGFDDLVLAGDWTSCGLDAGCIEAAVLSGLEAANAVLGRPPQHGVLGSWYPTDRAGGGR